MTDKNSEHTKRFIHPPRERTFCGGVWSDRLMEAPKTDDQKLVLVVDDDEVMRLLLVETVRTEGFRVEEASNGKMALEILTGLSPDLVLLDVMMPKLDGFGTCAAIRGMPCSSDLPILMMTGLDDMDSINRAYEVGATDFITKPLNYVLLRHRLRYILRAKNAMDELRHSERRLLQAQRIARLGNWEWDPDRNSVRLSEQTSQILGLSLVVQSRRNPPRKVSIRSAALPPVARRKLSLSRYLAQTRIWASRNWNP